MLARKDFASFFSHSIARILLRERGAALEEHALYRSETYSYGSDRTPAITEPSAVAPDARVSVKQRVVLHESLVNVGSGATALSSVTVATFYL